MASLAVFVFVLEKLPGFEHILNSTLHDISTDSLNVSLHMSVSQCDNVLEEIIWQNIKNYKSDSKLNDQDNYVDSLVTDDISTNTNIDKIEVDNEESANNFKNSSFFVAIFESVLNVTAQTCGGTLVSPHWVITAATCVDLLSHLYKNKNSNILDSHYSIIANAINPLIDGTVHNVTEIIFQPTHNSNSEMNTLTSDLKSEIKIPSLALLRIEPPVNENFIEIVSEEINPGHEVDIYSWVLTKNARTKQDTMTAKTFEGITLESNDCKTNYSFIENNSLICLSVFNENDLKTHQINSGGPVVISVGNKLLLAAVAQLDLHFNFVGYLLHPHYSWILEVISK